MYGSKKESLMMLYHNVIPKYKKNEWLTAFGASWFDRIGVLVI